MACFDVATEEVEKIDEAEEIVLEPENDFIFATRMIERLLLIEELGPRAQQVPLQVAGGKPRALLDPVVLREPGARRPGDQRLAKRDMTAGNVGAPRRRSSAVAVVNVNHRRPILFHGRHRRLIHPFVPRSPVTRAAPAVNSNAARPMRGTGGECVETSRPRTVGRPKPAAALCRCQNAVKPPSAISARAPR